MNLTRLMTKCMYTSKRSLTQHTKIYTPVQSNENEITRVVTTSKVIVRGRA